ncbi:hypothetical protein AR457_40310 [Streptomyces agglomeratus]|nr:hypothetical protein AR457_40310 [Streptomyces agglomeratus]OEJ36966.1 hypothetical protein BGK70_00965 [Streptomyces agglomeratus]
MPLAQEPVLLAVARKADLCAAAVEGGRLGDRQELQTAAWCVPSPAPTSSTWAPAGMPARSSSA